MRGTIVCGVDDTEEGRGALELAAELSERLGLRFVLAHVAEGIPSLDVDGDESVTMRDSRDDAARLVAQLAAEHGLADRAEQRSGVGDAATLLGQIAAEGRRRDLGRSRLSRPPATRLREHARRPARERSDRAGRDRPAAHPAESGRQERRLALTSS